jgi:hypothetical protein
MRQFVLVCAFAAVTAAGSAANGGWYNCMFGGPFIGDCCYNCYCYYGECGGCDPRCYADWVHCCPDPNYLYRPDIPRPTGCWTKAPPAFLVDIANGTCCNAQASNCCGTTNCYGGSSCCDAVGPSCCAPVGP